MAKSVITVELLLSIKCYILFFFKSINEYFITNGLHFRRRCRSDSRLDGKIVVITGGNTGIGKETALQLSLRGAKIIIGCRDLVKAENAVKDIKEKNPTANIIVFKLDLSSLTSVQQFSDSVAERVTEIDILINNAGVMMCPEWQTEDGFEMQFATNYLGIYSEKIKEFTLKLISTLGHFQLSHSLMHLLRKSSKARIISVSSVCHILGKIHFENINLKNENYSPMKAYAQSKLAIILSARELARRLGPHSNVNVYSLHPGVIETEITRHFPIYLYYLIKYFMTTIELGTQTTLYCALESALDSESGFYYDDCRRVDSMVSQARDDSTAHKLYELSCDLVKLDEGLKIVDTFKAK